jgi:tetratricopeptide (TPR) repeat protein
MSDWFWEKLSLYVGWLALVLLFALTVLAASIEIKDLDIWLHLASGRYILETFTIPQADIFSATMAGKPWVNHEWLFQLCLYSMYALNGVNGLTSLQIVLVGTTFLVLLFLGYDRDRQAVMIATLLLVVLVYQLRFFLRPDIFSILFFILTVAVLALKLHRRSSILILFVLQVIWTNIHGFFILGPLLVLLSLAAEWAKRKVRLPFELNAVGRLDDEEFKRLHVILPVMVLACLINPYFLDGAIYPLKVIFSVGDDSRVFFHHIGELSRPFDLMSFFDPGNYLFYKLLIVISALSFLLNYRRIEIGIFFLWAVFLSLSILAVRNVAYFAVVAYLSVLSNAPHIHFRQFFSPQLDKPRLKMMCSIGLKLVLIWAMLAYIQARSLRGYYDFDNFERKSEHGGLSLRNYPYKAVDFLFANGIKGRFFNDFNSGAYLIGRLAPNVKVFIDGRTELYGGDFFETYNRAWKGDTRLFDELAERYALTGAFLNSVYVPAPEDTIRHLYESPQWALVYFDYDATVFLRRIPENAVWIERFELDLERRSVPKADLMKFKGARITPYRYTNRAQALYNIGLYDQAKREAQEALSISATDAIAYKVIGKTSLMEKDGEKALENLRQAKMLDPGDVETRFYLALAYYRLGKLDLARSELGKVLGTNPDNLHGLVLSAKIFQKLGQEERAVGILEKARGISSEKTERLMTQWDG